VDARFEGDFSIGADGERATVRDKIRDKDSAAYKAGLRENQKMQHIYLKYAVKNEIVTGNLTITVEDSNLIKRDITFTIVSHKELSQYIPCATRT